MSCAGREPVDHNDEILPVIDPIRIRAAEIASSMDDRLLAAQVLISGIDGSGSISAAMKTLFQNYPPF
jgi:hypothetical protein